MSEEILKALTQLFAIITKQDEGVTAVEKNYVTSFFKQRLNAQSVKEYIKLYEEFLQDSKKKERPERPDRPRRADRPERKDRPSRNKLTSVKDSVRTLSICKKINKTLTQKQKVIVLIELLELVNSDKNFTPQRRQIINTVSTVFNIEENEYQIMENFVLSEETKDLDSEDILISSHKDPGNKRSLFIQSENLDGHIFILKVKSVELYFIKYKGSDEILLNNHPLGNQWVQLFSNGSTVKPPIGVPLYYSDIVAQFNHDLVQTNITFNVKNLEFKFPNGAIGLRDINITEKQGKLIGIMGASGAGKTTLLNALAGLEKPSKGQVLINGIDIHEEKDKVQGVIGYISQDDILIEDLTVFENLYYNAKMCFRGTPEKELIQLVRNVLSSLGLEHIKHLKVGNVLNKKISGGQRKRLNIALELIREPAVMFVDEPTSGLSSRDSENVIDLLKELSLKGKLIFVVIHQPSSEIYKKFDKMFIMDTGGYPIYYGNPIESIVYFKKASNQINSDKGQCSECGNVNPEQMFDIIEERVVNEYGQETIKRKVTPPEWAEHYNKSFNIEHLPDEKEAPPKNLKIPNPIIQWWIYTLRDLKSKVSNSQYLVINLLEAPFLALLLAFIIRYKNTNEGTEYTYMNNENIPAYILMSIVVSLFMGLTVSAEEIIKDRKILKREKFLNLSKNSYLFSKFGLLFTLSAIQTISYVLVGNWILEIHGMTFSFWLTLFSVSCFANILGLNISASLNSAVTVYIVIPLLLIPQMILSGALFSFDKLNEHIANKESTPIVADLMASRWAYEAISVEMYTQNEYFAYFYELESNKSQANFFKGYHIPRVQKKIKECENLLRDYSVKSYSELPDSIKPVFEENFKLIKNETLYLNERSKNKTAPISDTVSVDGFDQNLASDLKEYLNQRSAFYNDVFNHFDQEINTRMETLELNGYDIRKKKSEFFNNSLDEIVRQTLLKPSKRIEEHDGRIIQRLDPIFVTPSPSGALDYRAHFYAPQKHLFGQYFSTFYFNISVIWFMSLLLYFTLYFDIFRKSLELAGKIKFRGKKEHH